MITERVHSKIDEYEDWKDGMNAFRLRTREELEEINEKLDRIMRVLNEQRDNS